MIKHMLAKHVTLTRLGHTLQCNKVLAIFQKIIRWYSIAQPLLLLTQDLWHIFVLKWTLFWLSCNPLALLSNGKIHNNGVSHGAVVSFSCNSGFQPLGSLQIKCFDGIWNESSPSCIGPVTLFNPLHYHISFFISITISLSLCIISF